MNKALIKLAYKQVIGSSSTGDFEKNVFNASYQEFLFKSQAYNMEGKFKTFSELKANDGRANSLHYKLSFAVGNFINRLNNRIPVLADNADNSLVFEVPKFELIESDITDKTKHQVAINYCTGILTLLDVIGEYMILAIGDVADSETFESFTLKMQPGLSVVFYHELINQQMGEITGHDTLLKYNIKGNAL
ncbi:hypothetical protein HDF18_16810 [Mucilaginibacter sp. X5P1]|uniref:hypothetical protein n=1 Tax=Mucilaginibacter sp. X5P1 TaxID=2723088 RepID=UPI00161CB37C|nr:hypothetical protein [Mucilaginibacter sp. X5P1]MBB6139293.1 hypothetical protein [Mucilaginibacter sp. X5P1]